MMISDLPPCRCLEQANFSDKNPILHSHFPSSRLLIYAAQPAQSHGEPVLTCTCQGSGAHTQTMTWGLLR
jgi:hypothetical protein